MALEVAEDGLKELSYDEYVPIPSGGAIEMAMMLCNTQGIFTGRVPSASQCPVDFSAEAAPAQAFREVLRHGQPSKLRRRRQKDQCLGESRAVKIAMANPSCRES